MDFCVQVASQLVLKEIQKEKDHENIVLSPISFNAGLSMIAAGCTGQTLKQMLGFLGANDVDELNSKFRYMTAIATSKGREGGPDLCFLNGLWVDHSMILKESYKELAKTIYDARAKNVDFSQTEEVLKDANSWADSSTKGLIKKVLEPEHIIGTRLLLGNALYFKGSWSDNFNERLTRNRDFYLLNGDKVSVPFMTGCNKYTYGSLEDYQVVKIPYQSGMYDNRTYSMYFFLPNERDGLLNLAKKANADPDFFSREFKPWWGDLGEFYIPKFKFSYTTLDGLATMKELGMTLPFRDDCKELSEIVYTYGKPFFINMIIQKALVEIDEEGTKAAAVTFAGGVFGSCLNSNRPKFVADHPFLFMVREETSKLVLFNGAVLNPLLRPFDG